MENFERISERAGSLFGNGFHCAEAVAMAVLEGLGRDGRLAAAHATAFGGGFGKTYEEACGALSGALIAIGHLCGRQAPGEPWDTPAELGAAIRQQFVQRAGATRCITLRDSFGEADQMVKCRELVQEVTRDLLTMLPESLSCPSQAT